MKKTKQMLAALLAAAVTITALPLTSAAAITAINWGTKPADGTTQGQPFPAGTGGSQNFRIPGIVTLNDGTLVASADARWNHGGDACGLDTIVSRSTDNGENWSYTFANYLGDYGNNYHSNSTAFIDPAIATDGETVYMIADVWPGSYAINTAPNRPITGNEFDTEGNLLLSGDNRKTYAYHLAKNTAADADEDSYYVIKDNASGAVVEDYTIDAYYNIKDNTGKTNLFCDNSPYLVYPTDYLYLTKSKDGGATWSIPSLLNLKRPTEKSLLVGPGRGIVTSTGRIVFTAYEFTDGDRNSACIYSDDGGETWHRGQSVPQVSSEAAIVEADGKLYIFTRHGGYNVSEDWGESWSPKKDPGISYNLSCELSAITYSKKIDGKTAIIFSAPSNTGSRAAGKLFVGLVEKDGTISWDYDYSVNGNNTYAYSCLTELKDGSIGLLYESGGTAITYTNIPISDVAPGALISSLWYENEDGEMLTEINMSSGDSAVFHVFHLNEDAVVTAASDNEELLSARVENGRLIIESNAVDEGLARGIITLTDGTDTLQIKVNVSPDLQYEVLEMRMGETYTVWSDHAEDADVWIQDDKIAKVERDSQELIIEALKEGDTIITIGDTTYYVFVKNDVKELDLRRGQTLVVEGSVIQEDADASIVSVTKNEKKPPYGKVKEIESGKAYLIGNSTHIVTSGDSEADNPLGRAMKSADYKAEDLFDFVWMIQEEEEGYTIQNKEGMYMNFTEPNGESCAVTVSETPQMLAVSGKDDGFAIGYAFAGQSYYLNNFGKSNKRAAGYSSNDNTWYFYQTADSYSVKGIAEGKTSLIISGTTYHITVGDFGTAEEVREILNDTMKEAKTLLQQSGLETVYTKESVEKLQKAYQAVEEILSGTENQQMEVLKKELSNLEQAMRLEKNPEKKPGDENNDSNNGNKDQNDEEIKDKDLPAKKSLHSYKNADYIVTSSTEAGGTVTYKNPTKKTKKTITVPDIIKIQNRIYKVTEIAPGAFKGYKRLTQITIGANVVKIGKSAFEKCEKLKKITIQSKVLKSAGKKTLKGVHKKCTIHVPKKKKKAYKRIFQKAGLKSSMKVK